MNLSPAVSQHSSESETTSKSSSDSLPQVEARDRHLFSILQTITSKLLQGESFSTLPELGQLSFSSLPSTSISPRDSPEDEIEDDDDVDMKMVRALNSMLVVQRGEREPHHQQSERSNDSLKEHNQDKNSSSGPIVLPKEIGSLDEILDIYCEAVVLNNEDERDDDTYCSGSTVDSILIYKARQRRAAAAAADAAATTINLARKSVPSGRMNGD
eukprot:CAMPEP_0119015176 /NCGR_PEP_ID=MMETSP1176-20130426/10598_1 /TAXON_ID=265551 /ORGANISM="Synedropsis recta cf, Strain CCMP1620" /LENGTH=213 /DNA_ID=CAMNT_0006968445 /DNA_START=93 /DNA_END=734 /DNA_ORIENTATION=-